MHVAERAGKPENPRGHPKVRSHIGVSGFVLQAALFQGLQAQALES